MVLPDGARRLLRFLANGPASLCPASLGGRVLVEAAQRGTISIERGVLDHLAARGIVVLTSHGAALSGEGASLARRLADAPDGSAGPDRDIGLITVEDGGESSTLLANLAESPLAQLARRKTRDGAPFLTAGEIEAGERLRADYTRGQIMPRLGANWVASVASGKRAGGGGVADLTDAALGARRRVEDAVGFVGPELSGVLIDVCCFLKGLELVERERGWPVRSAKIVLKTALGALARHYFPERSEVRRRGRRKLHWGAADYRPKIA